MVLKFSKPTEHNSSKESLRVLMALFFRAIKANALGLCHQWVDVARLGNQLLETRNLI